MAAHSLLACMQLPLALLMIVGRLGTIPGAARSAASSDGSGSSAHGHHYVSDWRFLSESPPSSSLVRLRFALRHRNADELAADVLRVSSPDSPHYGAELRSEKIAERYGADPADIERLFAYLQTKLANAQPAEASVPPLARAQLTLSAFNDYAILKLSVAQAERLLGQRCRLFTHAELYDRPPLIRSEHPLLPNTARWRDFWAAARADAEFTRLENVVHYIGGVTQLPLSLPQPQLRGARTSSLGSRREVHPRPQSRRALPRVFGQPRFRRLPHSPPLRIRLRLPYRRCLLSIFSPFT
jgi:hypothetical protein